MHPDLEQPDALARLLRQLPDAGAPPYAWSEFQRRAEQRVLGRRSILRGQALAGVAVIAVAVVALSMRITDRPDSPPATRPAAQPAYALPGAPTERLERWLASLPEEPAVIRVGTRAAVTGLEDRIAEVDDLLSAEGTEPVQPARLAALQRERTRLVRTLAQVRYAETLADSSAD
jgi:hypothetical protein